MDRSGSPEEKSAGRRRRGRPRKAPEELRNQRVVLSLTPAELEVLDRRRGELSRQHYLQHLARRGRQAVPPVPQINREEWVRLYQLERGLERRWKELEGQPLPATAAFREEALDLLVAMHQEVIRLRRALLIARA